MGVELPVGVNISANNLLDPDFADKLRLLLRDTGVPAHLIELEVTENALMRSPDAMLKRLHEIREIGVRMSIDDFSKPVVCAEIESTWLARLAVATS